MTCAGCDPTDCPTDAWHLHVTVQPHWSWSLKDVSSALQRDIDRHGIRPLVVTNHFRDGRQSYRELIPTKHVRGTEAEASREIFKMGILLNNAGWRVKRLKIEGDPSHIREGRALYYETHFKIPVGENHATYMGRVLPMSTNVKNDIICTLRRNVLLDVQLATDQFFEYRNMRDTVKPRIEAAVLDTAPELDHDWINQ